MEDKVFRALADPTRRTVLDLLFFESGQTLGALCANLAMTRQSASQHVDILADANLVATAWKGREKLHFINPVPIHEVYARWVRKFEEPRLDFLHTLKQRVERENSMAETKFVYVTYIAASAEKIFDALITSEITKIYWGAENVSDWKPGASWQHIRSRPDMPRELMIQGTVVEVDRPRRLVFTWEAANPDPGTHPSRVTFLLEPAGTVVRLTMTHDQLEEGSSMHKGISGGWPRVLAGLKSYLETGQQLDIWAHPKA